MLILLRLIKSVSPGTRCSVLTDDLRRLGIASPDGADAVVSKGHRPPSTSRRSRDCSTGTRISGPQQQMADERISSAAVCGGVTVFDKRAEGKWKDDRLRRSQAFTARDSG